MSEPPKARLLTIQVYVVPAEGIFDLKAANVLTALAKVPGVIQVNHLGTSDVDDPRRNQMPKADESFY